MTDTNFITIIILQHTHICQIIALFTLNLHIICQLYLNKAGKKKKRRMAQNVEPEAQRVKTRTMRITLKVEGWMLIKEHTFTWRDVRIAMDQWQIDTAFPHTSFWTGVATVVILSLSHRCVLGVWRRRWLVSLSLSIQRKHTQGAIPKSLTHTWAWFREGNPNTGCQFKPNSYLTESVSFQSCGGRGDFGEKNKQTKHYEKEHEYLKRGQEKPWENIVMEIRSQRWVRMGMRLVR